MDPKRRLNFARPLLVALALLCAACASTPPEKPAPTVPVPAPPPQPVAPPPPTEAQIREDKAQAQKLALEAVDQLQNGDEAGARATLERAQALDAGNELARKLIDQVRADPQKELGSTFFRYTVQPDDSLSKLAQRFLGDRLRFYILARYNDIANPSRLQAGQVVKIPGTAPPPAPVAARPPGRAVEPVETVARPAAEPEAKPTTEAERLYRAGLAQQKAGNLDAAYASLSEAARRAPGNDEYAKQADAVRRDLVRRYDRDATQAFQRQNLDLAIKNWDRVLELDPDNQKAKLERARAEDLRKRMQDKFGTK
jgi:tetratricopeptide (TPR) repeat protein